ncbi:MAG: Adenylate cyclase [Candidatus Ozemobacter sibiricus]|uniref:Adenylate cyclase n=1 Tax=Candidatus Ozemobacter sibiricus TaxID=2268124 RepID=A0A367ZM09_9BACT|nr:MAG: Adenylate cyclase [Candidatus Ozemobacter sibiricus]
MTERTGSAKDGRVAAWLLPLLLSVLPWLVLQIEADGLRTLQREEQKREWADRATRLAHHLQERAAYPTWVELAGRQLQEEWRAALGEAAPTPARNERALRRAAARTYLPGGRGATLWAASFPDPTLARPAVLMSGRGFSTNLRFILARVLEEVGREWNGLPNQLLTPTWEARLRSTFGEGCVPDLFTLPWRGRAFYAILQGRQQLVVWNLLRRGGRPHGAFLLAVPVRQDEIRLPLLATLHTWKRVRAGEAIWPAFLPLPGPRPAIARPVLHPALRRPAARRLLRGLARRMVERPPPPDRQVGRTRLPAEATIEVVEADGWWGLAGVPSIWMAHLPVLVGPAPAERPLWTTRLARLYGACLGLAWGFLLLRRGLGRSWPALGVRQELQWWFVGLAATPMALIIATGEQFSLHLTSNREFQLTRRLERRLLDLETGSSRLTLRYQTLCRTLAHSPELLARLKEVETLPASQGDATGQRQADDLLRRCRDADMDVIGILLVDQHRCYAAFPPHHRLGPNQTRTLTGFHHAIANEVLRTFATTTTTSTAPSTAPSTPPAIGPRKLSTAAAIGGLGLFSTNQDLLPVPDVVAAISLGERHTLRYFNLIELEGQPRWAIFILWNMDTQLDQYLREAIDRQNAAEPDDRGARFFAFRRRHEGWQAIAGPPRDATLGQIARQLRTGTVVDRLEDRLLIAFPSRRLPGILLGATASLRPLREELAQEARRSGLALLAILGLVLLGGVGLERWLARPIVRMIDGLQVVAAERFDLEVRIAEPRDDELGTTGRTLDRMARWLQERQAMSRFVAPQVLEVVAHGDLEQAARPTARELVLLVSDVRSFTTLSETYPPDRMFALINRHLQIMTTILRQHGGVIDRFIGDAIQAVFFPSDSGASMVDRALSAARAMMAAHQAFNRERQAAGEFTYQIGIGIEVGPVVTGVTGDRQHRLDFTVLGEPFKHAADLEAASKGGRALKVVCSPAVRAQAGPGFTFLPLTDPSVGEVWELADGPTDPPTSVPPASSPSTPPPAPPGEGGRAPASSSSSAGGPTPATSAPLGAPASPAPGPTPSPTAPPGPTLADPMPPRPAAGPRSASAPAPAAADQATPRAPSRFVLAAGLGLWLFPLVLGYGLWHLFDRWAAARQQATLAHRLQDDLALFERSIDAQVQGSLLINRLLHDLIRGEATGAALASDLLERLPRKMRDLQSLLPRTSWFLFRHAPFFRDDRLASEGFTLVASGGAVIDLDPVNPLDLYILCMAGLWHVTPHLPKSQVVFLETQLGLKSFVALMRSAIQALTTIPRLGGRPRLALVAPLVQSQPLTGLPENHPRYFPTATRLHSFAHTFGGVLLFIHPDDLSADFALKAALRNLDGLGITAAIRPLDGDALEHLVHPTFLRYPALSQALGAADHRLGEPFAVPGFGVIRGRIVLDREYEVWLARPTTGLAEGPAIIPSWGVAVAALLWIGTGVALTTALMLGKGTFARSLTTRLPVVFVSAILPVLALGSLFMERSFAEARLRLETDQVGRLQRTMKAISETRDLYLAWLISGMERIFRHPDLRQVLHRLEQASNREDQRTFDTVLFALDRQNMRRGLPLSQAFVIGPGRLNLVYHRARGQAEPLVKFFSTMHRLSLRTLNPNLSTNDRSDLLMSVGIDEFRDFLSSIMSPNVLAAMLHAPRAVSSFASGMRQDEFLRFNLWERGTPRYGVQARLNSEFADFQHLAGWAETLAAPAAPCRLVGMLEPRAPGLWHRPPFWMPRNDGDADFPPSYDMDPAMTPLPWSTLGHLAESSGFPAFWEEGQAQDAKLTLAHRGANRHDRVLIGELPIGQRRASLEGGAIHRRLGLAAVLLLTLLLAMRIARRFLEPVLALAGAAARILAQDFTARLPVDRGGEFGRLAEAFNRVASGVEQGRLLSRFVSESVRVAAADDERGRRALAGEHLEVTVLFAGLAGFKHLLATEDPVTLVPRLNRFLETMARLIREAGGDIDKFIGDKILAVFHPDRLGGPAAAAAAAARAATTMRAAMARIRGDLDLPLGVGVVTGPVLAGIMGTPDVRLEYTVIGDTVNLASRLGDLALRLSAGGGVLPDSQGASGGVVLEARTYELLRTSPDRALADRLVPLELPPIKGKTRSVTAYRLNAPDLLA